MSDFLVDDWESLIDKDVEEIKAVTKVDLPKQEQPIVDAPKQTNTQPKKQKPTKEQVIVQQPKEEAPKPLTNQQKRRAELLSRLANDSLIDDLFDGLTLENKKVSAAQLILKNQKNFEDFAKTVSEKFNQDTPSEFLQDFCTELLINLYQLMQSSELRQIQEKLGFLKNQKKKQQKKKKKEPKKEVKKEEILEKKEQKVQLTPQQKDPRYVPGMEDFM